MYVGTFTSVTDWRVVSDEFTERDRIPEALPEVERLPEPGDDADDADDVVEPDAKPLAGQEPG